MNIMNLTIEELKIIKRYLCGCQECRRLFNFITDNALYVRVVKEIKEREYVD
jgi:hypothetical protein